VIGGVVAVALLLVVVAAVVAIPRLTGDEETRRGFGPGPTQEPEEQWATDIDEDSEIALVADDERVYALEQVSTEDGTPPGEDPPTNVRAFAASDGEELWEAEVQGFVFQGTDTLVPLGDDQVLLVDSGGDETTTKLLDAETGEEMWEVDGQPSSGYSLLGFFGGPSIQGASVIVFEASGDDAGDSSVAAVDRDSGEELWSETASGAYPCGDVVIAYEEDPDDDGGFSASPITAYDADDGEELWDADGEPGLCDDAAIAIATDTDEVQVRRLSDGDEVTTLGLPDGDEAWFGIPFGDFVVVQRSTSDDETVDADAEVHRLSGGEPTWEETGVSAFPVGGERLLVGPASDEGDQDVFLVRASDGERIGDRTFPADMGDNSCDGAFSDRTAIACTTGSSDVSSYELDGLEELWSVDAGADVLQVALGGNRLFVATDGGELLGFG